MWTKLIWQETWFFFWIRFCHLSKTTKFLFKRMRYLKSFTDKNSLMIIFCQENIVNTIIILINRSIIVLSVNLLWKLIIQYSNTSNIIEGLDILTIFVCLTLKHAQTRLWTETQTKKDFDFKTHTYETFILGGV